MHVLVSSADVCLFVSGDGYKRAGGLHDAAGFGAAGHHC